MGDPIHHRAGAQRVLQEGALPLLTASPWAGGSASRASVSPTTKGREVGYGLWKEPDLVRQITHELIHEKSSYLKRG